MIPRTVLREIAQQRMVLFHWLPVAMACGLAAAGWLVAERPDILISRDARLVGVMTDNGRVISKARGDQFTADIWAENDGQPVARDAAHALWQTTSPKVIHIWSKKTNGNHRDLHVRTNCRICC